MRTIAAGVVLSFIVAHGVEAQTLSRYAETVWLNADGSARIVAEVDVPARTSGTIAVPLAAPSLTNLAVTGAQGARAEIATVGGRGFVSLSLGALLANPARVQITADAPAFFPALAQPAGEFGNRVLTRRVVNATPMTIGTLSSEIVLPPGYAVTSIQRSEPAGAESSTAPPYAIGSREGRHTVRIATRDVALGGATAVTFRFKERRPSLILPAALAALSLAYLIGFRGLITRRTSRR